MLNKLLIFTFIVFYSFNASATIRSHCFNNRSIKIDCVNYDNGNASLEGEFVIKSQGKDIKYEFGSRRAWPSDWCPPNLKQIKYVMSAPRFCIEAEMNTRGDKDLLMIEGVFSSKGQWTYFDEYKRQGVLPL